MILYGYEVSGRRLRKLRSGVLDMPVADCTSQRLKARLGDETLSDAGELSSGIQNTRECWKDALLTI